MTGAALAAPRGARHPGLLAAALILVALNLRPAVAAISPVLDQVRRTDHLSATLAGVLTADPVLCFGAFAFATPALIRRSGMDRLLWWTMAALLAGIALRWLPGDAALWVGTTLIGAAIGVANVVLPGIIKRDFADRVGLMTSLYAMCLSAGAAVAAGVTVPIEHAGDLSWRGAVAVWGLATVAALVAWPRGRRSGARRSGRSLRADRPRGLWGSGLAWGVTAFMGMQSLSFYAAFAWIPTVLEAAGIPATAAGAYLSVAGVTGIVGSLAAPTIARRSLHAWVPPTVGIALLAVGLLGLATAPAALPGLWTGVLGLGQGLSVALALSYIVLRAPDPTRTGQLSTMAQGTGYLLAAAGPFGLGALHALAGGWLVPLVVLAVLLVPQLLAGLVASSDRHVAVAPEP